MIVVCDAFERKGDSMTSDRMIVTDNLSLTAVTLYAVMSRYVLSWFDDYLLTFNMQYRES